MTLLAKYSRVALLVGVCLIGLAAAQEAAKDPAMDEKPDEMIVTGGSVTGGSEDALQAEVAGLLDKPIGDVAKMVLDNAKEGMQYVCDYKAAPDASADASAQSLFSCGLQCTPAIMMALPSCTSVAGCFTAIMPALGSCSDCADTVCQNSIVSSIAAPVCQSSACQLLPAPAPAACAGVCSFCGF